MLLPVTITSSSTGGTSWATGTATRTDNVVQLDYGKYGGTAVEAVVTTSGAGLTYNVEWTADAPVAVSSVTGSSQQTWYSSGSSALSSNAYVSWSFPVRCV